MLRNEKIWLTLLLIAFFRTSISYANDGFIHSYQLGVYAGLRNTNCDSFALDKNLDFVNTMYSGEDNFDYMYLGIDFSIKLGKSVETDLSLLFVDSYLLNNINFQIRYLPFRNFGISAGYYSFDYFINNYDYYFRISEPKFYVYDDDQFFQRRIKDHGFIFGPVFRLKSKGFTAEITLNSGFVCTKQFVETFYLKEINSNYRKTYQYNTNSTWTPVFFPEIKTGYDFKHTQKTAFGIQIQANYFIQDKTIDYKLSTYSWTKDDPATDIITNPRHSFNKFELDLGFYFRW